ncbi:phosphatidate cytidylyltransferase [Bacillus sp. SL00103]
MQLGDLVESALKRHYDVKDSGTTSLDMAVFWTGLIAFYSFCRFYIYCSQRLPANLIETIEREKEWQFEIYFAIRRNRINWRTNIRCD